MLSYPKRRELKAGYKYTSKLFQISLSNICCGFSLIYDQLFFNSFSSSINKVEVEVVKYACDRYSIKRKTQLMSSHEIHGYIKTTMIEIFITRGCYTQV